MKLIEHKRRYNAPRDNIGKSVIVDTLQNAKKYRRNTAWFRLSALKVWAPFLKDVTDKDIKIEILASLVGNPGSELVEELDKLSSPESKREYLQKFGNDAVLACAGLNIDPSQSSFRDKILRYLIASEKLEIRFAISKPFLNGEALYHKKEGYFILQDNSRVYFEGSFNESEGGMTRQGEHATVWSSYDERDESDLDNFIGMMDAEWEGEDEFTEIVPVAKETIDKIKEYVANDPDGAKNLKPREGQSVDDIPGIGINKPLKPNYAFIPSHYRGEPFKLKKHQDTARELWRNQDGKGLLAHATGSGKTITALYCLSEIAMKNQKTIVIIHVPYQPLADQWVDELSMFNLYPIQCYRSKRIWKNALEQKLGTYNQSNTGYVLPLVVVDNTFKSKDFQKILSTMPAQQMIYIADECHRFAKQGRTSKLPDARFRLGLSATPFNSNEEDSLGDLELKNYFGDVCHRYGIHEALEDGVLTPYQYKIVECYLNEEEMDKIKFQQQRQAQTRGSDKEEPTLAFNIASGKINRIMGQAEEKFQKLRVILSQEDIESAIFFCGDGSTETEYYLEDGEEVSLLRDVERVGAIAHEYKWRWRKFTYEQNFTQKKENLESFSNGYTDALVSIRVLDEGIDIPGIKKAFLLASTSNKRQYVQRRGRVLRTAKGKSESIIFDFVCLPPYQNSIASKEMRRVLEMGKDAINKDEILDYVNQKSQEFNLDDDITEQIT